MVTSDHWLKTAADTPLRDLVDSLDAIGTAPIPYARMPVRARTAFVTEFTTWADIAGETVQSLLTRQHAGHGTIKALIGAAEDTVKRYQMSAAIKRVGAAAATRRLLDELDDADRLMLTGRLFGPQQRTNQDIGEQLGVHGVWVTRHLPRAQAKFAELLTDPAHREVEECARRASRPTGFIHPGKGRDRRPAPARHQAGQRTVHVDVVSATTPVGERLRRHLGRRDVTEAALTQALNCCPEEIEDVLRKRGDDILADYTCSVLSQEWTDRSA